MNPLAQSQQSLSQSLGSQAATNSTLQQDGMEGLEKVSNLLDLAGDKSTLAEQKLDRLFLCGGITSIGETASCIAWSGNSEIKPRPKDGVPERTADPAKREADLVNFKKYPRKRASCACVTINRRLYVMGGHSQELGCLQSVLSRGKLELHWKAEQKMRTRRDGLAAVAFEDQARSPVVMALGGNNGIQILNSVEQNMLMHSDRHGWLMSQWVEAPNMALRRANHTACALPVPSGDPPIFVAGGYTDGTTILSEVETFSWATTSWQMEKPMLEARASHGMVVLNNRIYVIGGTDGNSSLKSVEAYDRREGVWRKVVPMKFGRTAPATAVMDNRIVVVGGRQYMDAIQLSEFFSAEKAMSKVDFSYKAKKPKEFVDVVEVYDDRASRWDEIMTASKIKETALDRAHAGHCVF